MKKIFKITLFVLGGLVILYHLLKFLGIFVIYTVPTSGDEPNIKCGTFIAATNLKTPERGDFITFIHEEPIFGKSSYIFRLCGVSNDTIQIVEGTLFVNGKNFDANYNLKHSYLLTKEQFTSLRDTTMFHYLINHDQSNPAYLTFVEDADAERFQLSKDRYRTLATVPNPEIQKVYHKDWNKDHFGPLIIPKGKVFVLGDNRDNARDSRFIGLIDTTAITGVLWKTLF